ncbi:sugar kinase [Paenibacillus sp. IB182496]|uniref:Sugar kinase n=1 Tax=Paenibacillus sabuli TaxID=2772509 RepID=A0A927GRF9_9BACL|nr:sugar kinase [Paenibacillus sabuli]MBD2844667.1 sugar kinase [Paenibacillus sabuli]
MDRQSPDLVTFGETMALFMPANARSLDQMGTVVQGFGGAESNVAIGVARLGGSVGWFGALGRDPFGTMIYKTLRGEGVDVSRARLVEGEETGVMFREQVAGRLAVHYRRKHSAASRMGPEELDADYIRGAKLLHVTGITAALGERALEAVRQAVAIAKAAGVKVVLDPNLRLKLWSAEEAARVLLPLAEQADYFMPGWDELQLLYGTEDFDEAAARLGRLQAVSVVKGVGERTVIVEGERRSEVPFYPAERIVDTVGAGDGFCAGFLAGVLRGMSAVEAVRLASVCGSLVIQSHGDWEALPDWQTASSRLSGQAAVER